MINADMVDIIKSLVETIAIAVSGLWVAWTFHKLQSVRAAEANLASTLKTTERTSLEARESERRLLAQQPNLDISIVDLAQHQSPGSERHLALGVNLRNLGSRNLSVEFDRATLSVGRYALSSRGLPEMSDIYRTSAMHLPETGKRLATIPYRILRAGQERQLAFVAPLSGEGTYLIQFQALYYMILFDGEDSGDYEPFAIQAIQQRVFHVD